MKISAEVWYPRFRKFRPPLWFIFRWAYNVRTDYVAFGYPITMRIVNGMKIEIDENGARNFDVVKMKASTRFPLRG